MIPIVVQARMDSRRLYGKVLMPITGGCALSHLLDRLFMTEMPVIVATSDRDVDKPLQMFCEHYEIDAFYGAVEVPKRLWSVAELKDADHIVRVTADDILVDPEYLRKAVKEHIKYEADFTHIPKLPRGFDCEVISRKALLEIMKIDSNTEYIGEILKDKTLFNIHEVEVPKRHRRRFNYELNEYKDLKKLRELFSDLFSNHSPPFCLDNVIEYLDYQKSKEKVR
jgi:spore coat polysaccharide biosynthesis protein SpsF